LRKDPTVEPGKPLKPDELVHHCNPDQFSFDTTDDLPDLDGFIRRGVIHLNRHPSFAAAVAERMQGRPSNPHGRHDRDFPINFPGPAGTVRTVSYYQALDPDLLPADFFRQRAVIIGVVSDAAPDLKTTSDSFPVPFYRFNRCMMPGVEIQAAALATVMAGFPLTQVPDTILFSVYWMLALSLFFVRNRPVYLAAVSAGIALVLAALSVWLFIGFSMVAEVVSGIGFLGAGAILRIGVSIKGLTTAASLWTTAAIGLACGAGFYWPAVLATVLVLFSLFLLGKMEKLYLFTKPKRSVFIEAVDTLTLIGDLEGTLGKFGYTMDFVEVDRDTEKDRVEIQMVMRPKPGAAVEPDLSRVVSALLALKEIENVELR